MSNVNLVSTSTGTIEIQTQENRYDRNPNTGNEFGTDAETVKATQTVYHDTKHPSHITLPIIPR